MNKTILNYDAIVKGDLEVYTFIDGMYPTKGIITGRWRKDKLTYEDEVEFVVYANGTFNVLSFDIITLAENDTDHLEIRFLTKAPTFITTSKATMMEYIRKYVLSSPHIWAKGLTIESNYQRKHTAASMYHDLLDRIKKLK